MDESIFTLSADEVLQRMRQERNDEIAQIAKAVMDWAKDEMGEQVVRIYNNDHCYALAAKPGTGTAWTVRLLKEPVERDAHGRMKQEYGRYGDGEDTIRPEATELWTKQVEWPDAKTIYRIFQNDPNLQDFIAGNLDTAIVMERM